MAQVQVPVTCYRCRGSKALYASALGDLASHELGRYELLDLLRSGAVTAKVCPVCGGQGTTSLQVTRPG